MTRAELDRRRGLDLLRHRRVLQSLDSTHVESDGRKLVNFASNNYLGLTHHPAILRATSESLVRDGAGSGAAPLICGYSPAHRQAERDLASLKKAEAAVILSSGFQANLAAVQTLDALGQLMGKPDGVRFLLDKLCHASLVDAARGLDRSVTSRFRIYPHNDMAKLARLLDEADAGQLQVVVTESVFSMDGDAANLDQLSLLKRQHGFLLLLDEAHGTGVYGTAGAGFADERGHAGLADVVVVTFSKALGCVGAAICGSTALSELAVNVARPFIYSTAPPALVGAAVTAAIRVMREEPDRQQRVRHLAGKVRTELEAAGIALPAGDSPIIPVQLGSESAAMAAAECLKTRGLLVIPIRPPTVARGTSRLRITLSSDHTDDEITFLVEQIIRQRQLTN